MRSLKKYELTNLGLFPLYCVSPPGYTWKCGLKYTGINLQTCQDEHLE